MLFPEETFKAIPKMSQEEAGDILDNWLKDAARSLTSQQQNETKLPLTIRKLIHSLFDRLERIHGKMLVSHALAYISGSKNGLTQSELEDLISLDDDILNDVY